MNPPTTLTLFVVRYYLDNPLINQRYQWKAIYFSRPQAEDFSKTLAQHDFISLTEEPTNSAIYTESITTPYRYLCGDRITLGDFLSSKMSYVSTAYTSEALLKVAQPEFDQRIALARKAQDSYYSRQWV